MIDIVDRLRFDSSRCRLSFSKGVATNIDAAIEEIERLREALKAFRSEINLQKSPKLAAKIDAAINQQIRNGDATGE